MNKLFSACGVALTMSVTFSAWAENACAPIAEACMEAGYYKGGNTVGKGLVENCVMPIAAKTKTLPNANFSNALLQQCKATIVAKLHQNH